MRRVDIKRVGLGSACVLVGIALPSTVLAQKSPDVRVNTDMPEVSSSFNPLIAAFGDSVYVTWTDTRNGGFDIYFNRSIDGGANWLASDLRLNTDTPGLAESVDQRMVASDDSIYVLWQDDRNDAGLAGRRTDIYFNRSLDGGDTWLPSDMRLDTDMPGESGSITPYIAASGDSVYAVWQDERDHAVNIHFNRSLDAGSTWLGSDLRVSTNLDVTFREFPQVATSGNSVYVAWQDDRNDAGGGGRISDIYLNCSPDRGAHWLLSEIKLNTNPPGSSASLRPQLAASGEFIYLTWWDDRNGFKQDIYFNRSADRGATWLPADIRLDTNLPAESVSVFPKIAAAGDAVYVTWWDNRNGESDIYFNRSLDGGVTWLPADVRLDTDLPGAARSVFPTIVVSGDAVHVTWSDRRSGVEATYYNRSLDQGATWLPADIRLDTGEAGATASITPEVAASGDSVYVTWSDERSGFGTGDIYANIPFGTQPYGAGTPGSDGFVPQLEGTDNVMLGSTFTLTVTEGLGGSIGFLAIGGPNSKAAIPLVGGELLVGIIDRIVPITMGGTLGASGEGIVSIGVSIPMSESLLGFNINFQSGFLDPRAYSGLSLTNGVEAWIL